LFEVYFAKYKKKRTGQSLARDDRYAWNALLRTTIARANGSSVGFGEIDVRHVTRHDLEALRDAIRVKRSEAFNDSLGRKQTWRRGGPVAANRALRRLRTFYRWAIDEDYLTTTPFKKTIASAGREFARERRLVPDVYDAAGTLTEPGEERRLLAAAGPHLSALIIAALETCCRIGELLSLQWKEVRFDLNALHLPAEKTKARRARRVPMSTRLRAVLEMRRTDPAGDNYGPDAYVFVDASGARVSGIKAAWEDARLKAHGVAVERSSRGLSATCRAALGRIDLHFHDLRREAASRLLEGGMPLSYVQRFVDHKDISMTNRYLQVTEQRMHDELKRVEERAAADNRSRCKVVASAPAPTESSQVVGPGKFLR
jgi:integrase